MKSCSQKISLKEGREGEEGIGQKGRKDEEKDKDERKEITINRNKYYAKYKKLGLLTVGLFYKNICRMYQGIRTLIVNIINTICLVKKKVYHI